jgi:hypothetical protein
VDDYAPAQRRPARSGGRFVAYVVRTEFNNPRYHFYTVEADLFTREVYAVKAWRRIDNVPPEPDYDRLFVPEIRKAADEFSAANGIRIPTEGRPAWSLEHGGVDHAVWHDFFAGKLHYTFECTNKRVELAVQKRVMQDILGEDPR